MPEYNIPMTAGPQGAAANIDTRVPERVDASLPLKLKPFEPIDDMANRSEALSLKDKEGAVMERAGEREDKAKDKMLLEQYKASGGDLYSPEGLEKAGKELQGKLSMSSLQNLAKLVADKRGAEIDFRTKLAKMSSAELATFDDVQEQTSKLMSGTIDVYDKTLADTGDQTKALQAFEAAKLAAFEASPGAMKAGQRTPEQMAALQKITPDQVRHDVENSAWHGKMIKEAADIELKKAKVSTEESRASKYDAEVDAMPLKFKQAQQRIDNAAERSAKTGQFDPKDADAAAKMIAEYNLKPLSAYAMRTPYGQRVMTLVSQLNPTYDAKEFDVKAKAAKDFTTGTPGRAAKSFNVAISHLNTLDELGAALNNSDMQSFNKIANYVGAEFNATAPTNFDSAKQIVAAEIVKAVTGAAGALGDRETAEKSMSRANTPAQLREVIRGYKTLMNGQLKGLEKQYTASTGKTDFSERFLTDEAQVVRESDGKPSALPAGPATQKDFPKISPKEQASRDKGSVGILEDELAKEQEHLAAVSAPGFKPEDGADVATIKHRVQANIEALNREIKGKSASPKAAATDKVMSLDAYLKSKGH
jgi:hypothetical protein